MALFLGKTPLGGVVSYCKQETHHQVGLGETRAA